MSKGTKNENAVLSDSRAPRKMSNDYVDMDVQLLVESAQGLSEEARQFCNATVCSRYMVAARDNKQTAKDALLFLMSTVKWREEMGLENMETDKELLIFEADLQAHVLLYHLSVDAHSRPLLVERVGAWDLATVRKVISDPQSREAVMRAHFLVSERIRRLVDENHAAQKDSHSAVGHPVDMRATLVFDAKDLPWSIIGWRGLHVVFGEMSRLDAAHFPNTIGMIFILNVSRAVAAAWAVISEFVAIQTRYKVKIFSWTETTAAHAALCERCGAESLPPELGGCRTDSAPYTGTSTDTAEIRTGQEQGPPIELTHVGLLL